MRAAAAPQKLRFTVQACSGEVGPCLRPSSGSSQHLQQLMVDPHCHRTPNTLHGSCYTTAPPPGGGSPPGGHASPQQASTTHATEATSSTLFACRFCKYPHELLLRLDRPAKVQQIQILAHEFKVRACAGPMDRTAQLV
jgi:hypothetical protein